MRDYRIWLALLVLALLALALAFWLIPDGGSTVPIAAEPDIALSAPTASSPVPANAVVASDAVAPEQPEAQPKQPPAETELAVPVWEPLPPLPVPRFRKVTSWDFGYPDDAEAAVIRDAFPTRTFTATISGRVTKGGAAVGAGVRVRAEPLGETRQIVPGKHDNTGNEQLATKLWPSAAPSGDAVTDETGAFTLSVSVTGVDLAAVLKAAGLTAAGSEPDYVARILLRAEGEGLICPGCPVANLRANEERKRVAVEVFDGRAVKGVVRGADGKPLPHGMLQCWYYGEAAGNSRSPVHDYKVYADAEGRFSIPYHAALDLSIHVMLLGAYRMLTTRITEEKLADLNLEIQCTPQTNHGRAVAVRVQNEGVAGFLTDLKLVTTRGQGYSRFTGPVKDGWLAFQLAEGGPHERCLLIEPSGELLLPIPDCPEGSCVELDPIILPGRRSVQLRVFDAEGKPIADCEVSGVAQAGYTKVKLRGEEKLASGFRTDKDGRVNVSVAPLRTYELTFTHETRGRFVPPPISFKDAGPHEWRWQVESGK